MPKVQLKKEALQKTNEEFYKLYPNRRNNSLTQSPADAKLRAVWMEIYKKHAGQSALKTQKKIPTAMAHTAVICSLIRRHKKPPKSTAIRSSRTVALTLNIHR